MIRISLILLLQNMICYLTASAQNLSGTWEGTGGGTTVSIVLVKCGDKYVGYNHDKDGMGFCKTNIEAVFDTATKKLKITSKGFIEHTALHSQTNYTLTYSTSGAMQQLKGSAKAKGAVVKVLSFGMGIPVTLRKVSDVADTTAFMANVLMIQQATQQQDALVEIPAVHINNDSTLETTKLVQASTERKTLILKTISTTARKITITVFDNGVSDGDSISILHNNIVIASRIPVSLQRTSFEILLHDVSIPQQVILIAHNVGSIPPNTATIEITAGNKKYTLSASSDLASNAAIAFIYEPE